MSGRGKGEKGLQSHAEMADPTLFSLVSAQRPLLAATGRPPGHVQGGRAALRCNGASALQPASGEGRGEARATYRQEGELSVLVACGDTRSSLARLELGSASARPSTVKNNH